MKLKDIKSSIKDLKWKQLLLEKGEKVGLVVAAVLAVLMILPFLYYMILGNGPSANAQLLKAPTEALARKQQNSQPTDADKPPPGVTEVVIKNLKIEDPTPYQVAQFSSGSGGDDARKRREPTVFGPVGEIAVAVNHPQVVTYVFNSARDKIYVVENSTNAPAGTTNPGGPAAGAGGNGKKGGGNPYGGMLPGGGGMPSQPMGGGIGGLPGGRRGGMGGAGLGKPQGGYSPSIMGNMETLSKKELTPTPIPLNKLADQLRLEKVQPVRQVELDFAFPLRAQADEFERQLNLADYDALLADHSGEKDKENQPLPSFRFLGYNLKRQILDNAGNVIVDWTPIDLNGNYEGSFKDYLFLNGKRFEEDPAELEAIKVQGLTMPRLLAKSPDQYPRVELELPKILESLRTLKNANAPVLPAVKNPLALDDGFDVFKATKEDNSDYGSHIRQPGAGMGMPSGMPGLGMPTPGKPGKPGPGGGPKLPGGPGGPGGGPTLPGGQPYPSGPGGDKRPGDKTNPMPTEGTATDQLPEYALGRIIDLTVVPGYTYRYQIQVRMANPNKNLKNVYSPAYAEPEALLSSWFEVPQDVIVPQEMYFYAVDQKEIEPGYKGPNSTYSVVRERQAVFQMQKWLPGMFLPNNPGEFAEVGEWVVAERVPVYRGEFLGRNQRVQVPVWKPTHEAFVLMADKDPRLPGVPVNFSQADGSDLILVDFDGGEAKYTPANGKAAVTEPCALEAVVLAPDGKLLAHDSAIDAKDKQRVDRLKAYRERVKEVKSGKTGDGKSSPTNPFSGGGENRP